MDGPTATLKSADTP